MSALTQAELEKRFPSEGQTDLLAFKLAKRINEVFPDNHAKHQALLKLEETMMWIKKAGLESE